MFKKIFASLVLALAVVAAPAQARTGTGLDLVLDVIESDAGLLANVSDAERAEAASAEQAMNEFPLEGIRALGLANDGVFTTADAKVLNDWLYFNYNEEIVVAHGDDENGECTGFHCVQGNGSVHRLLVGKKTRPTINKVYDGLYHLGFNYPLTSDRLQNEDGNANRRWRRIPKFLNVLLADELASGILHNGGQTCQVN